METLKLHIKNIRNIKEAELELPFDNGIYTFVGSNGSGKSTIMECLSLLLPRPKGRYIYGTTSSSTITYKIDGIISQRLFDASSKCLPAGQQLRILGLYEGSLFYGTRFEDSRKIESMIANGKIASQILAEADDYLKEKLSFILHGDMNHYSTLKRIKNRGFAEQIGVKNRPYFISPDDHLVSQYRMSSGECLLISLLHFLYNSIVRRSLSSEKRLLVLIDELELALHPIAVTRLLDFLKELTDEHENLIVFLSSHSPEVIKKISPRNLYKVNFSDGILSLENNCYPSYLIRDLYSNVTPDYLLLVEDVLAQKFVSNIVNSNNLRLGKLVHIVPVGGWRNVLDLHGELYSKKVLGHGTKIISILDGDTAGKLDKRHKNFTHLFLPIQSIEKFLYSVIKENKNQHLRKIINDKFFIVDSLDTIVAEYNRQVSEGQNDTNKGFYAHLCRKLDEMGTKEDIFIDGICAEILKLIDTNTFCKSLEKILNS